MKHLEFDVSWLLLKAVHAITLVIISHSLKRNDCTNSSSHWELLWNYLYPVLSRHFKFRMCFQLVSLFCWLCKVYRVIVRETPFRCKLEEPGYVFPVFQCYAQLWYSELIHMIVKSTVIELTQFQTRFIATSKFVSTFFISCLGWNVSDTWTHRQVWLYVLTLNF